MSQKQVSPTSEVDGAASGDALGTWGSETGHPSPPGGAQPPAGGWSIGHPERRFEIAQVENGFILHDSAGGATYLVVGDDLFHAAAGLLSEISIRLGTSFYEFDDRWVNVRLERGERWYREHRSECPHDLGAYLPQLKRWACLCGQWFAPESEARSRQVAEKLRANPTTARNQKGTA